MWVKFNAAGNSPSQTIGVYTGSRGNLTELACRASSMYPEIITALQADTTYYIMTASDDAAPFRRNGLSIEDVQAPLTVDLQIDSAGSVNHSTGAATIRGTVTCSCSSRPHLAIQVEQKIGRAHIGASGSHSVTCNGATPWSMVLNSANGPFSGGAMTVSIRLTDYDFAHQKWIEINATATVNLRGSK